MRVKPEVERFAKIRVIGVGGAGGNVLNSMIDSEQIQGVDFIAVNTDAQDLSVNKAYVKVPIGHELTNGLGSGGDPEIGRKAAEESMNVLKSHLEGADMIFITAGMGGGTGTGASPIIARIAKELGALTIGVVTKPFDFEGKQREKRAEKGISELRKEVDALITIPNQKLLEVADKTMGIRDAFKLSDSILNQGVQGISDLVVMPGLINVDFSDVRTVMKDSGSALMGIGIGTGEDRAIEAARAAISSPLLEQSIEGATGILFNVIGGEDLTMYEVDAAANVIKEKASPDANIIFGTSIDDKYRDQIKITVIATGFNTQDKDKNEEEEEEDYEDLGFPLPPTLSRDDLNITDYGKNNDADEDENEEEEEDKKEDEEENTNEENIQEDSEEEKEEDLDKDYDSKYDIPAFLRPRK